jgi:phosphoadenosine phosphosulfate reductase
MKPREFIKEYGIRSLVCCFSGGKDSLVATHYVLSEIVGFEPTPKVHVVFVDTTVMVPIATEYVKEVCDRYGWPLKILKPEPDFWTLAEKWGCPTMKRRWCCYALKLKPIFEFTRKLPAQRAMIIGLRRDESKRRSKLRQIVYRKKTEDGMWVGAWSYAPIIDWTEKDVLRYIRDHDLPMPPHYRLGIKETCMCGAFSHVKEMMIVRALWPEFYQKFVELEGRFKQGGTAFYFNNRPYSAKEILAPKNPR